MIGKSEQDLLAGDLLVGAPAIKAYLIHLGMPIKTDPYYLKRIGWPIGSTTGRKGRGGKLIASKRKLMGHTQSIAKAD